MEINLPDRGIFKGIGKLETKRYINRKYFPNIRNMHQFQYTHDHPNQYKTSFQVFKPYAKEDYKYHKANKNSNQSHIQLGNDKSVLESENKSHYRKYNFSLPPKPIKHSEEGIGINDYSDITGEKIGYSTTSNDTFNALRKISEHQNVKYKYSRTDRFDPITGEFKRNTSFGFEDFVPESSKKYKAVNYTVIPKGRQKYDIISGRKLTFS